MAIKTDFVGGMQRSWNSQKSGESLNWCDHFGDFFSSNAEYVHICDLAVTVLAMYASEMHTYIHQKTSTECSCSTEHEQLQQPKPENIPCVHQQPNGQINCDVFIQRNILWQQV